MRSPNTPVLQTRPNGRDGFYTTRSRAFPSRRLRPTRPRPGGQAGAPTGGTSLPTRAWAGCLWCAPGRHVPPAFPDLPGSRAGSPGRRRSVPGPGRRSWPPEANPGFQGGTP